MPEKIGFVGVGRMGANMARHLKEVGYPIAAVYDVRRESAETVATELGAKACATLAEVTALSDIVITVVTDDKAMLNIFGNAKDNLLIGAKGRIFINCATISPATHVAVEKLAKKAKAKTLEGCMASSITQAREGSLYLMCGGDKAVFEKVKEAYAKMGLVVLNQSNLNNGYVMVVRAETAQKFKLETLSDLSKAAKALKVGAGPEFRDRKDGLPGLKAKYDMVFGEDLQMAIGLRYQALKNDQIQVVNGY